MKDDLLIAQPANPGANSEVTWINTEDGTYQEFAGLLGDLLFDQDVTVLVQTWADGGTPRTMNGGGDGEVIPASTPTPIRVGFLGANTQVKIATGDDAPTVWHANGRLTRGPLGGPADGTIAYGVPPNSPGPAGPAGADGADGGGGGGGGGYETVASGAIDPTKAHSHLDGSGVVPYTLADGEVDGFVKTIMTTVASADFTISGNFIYGGQVPDVGCNIRLRNTDPGDLESGGTGVLLVWSEEQGAWIVRLVVLAQGGELGGGTFNYTQVVAES